MSQSCLAPAIERSISAHLLVSVGTTFHTDKEVGLGFLSASLADCPRILCELSARCQPARCSSCFSRVLGSFRFDSFSC
jgi:hypothetical protein